ncbi:MAG: DedA family protein [Actinomycetota bacterium]|jgi:undecaprenyl-diphosphatase|nr:DedA family protein [Actinomycetota bacterium]MCL6093842.1 DedA family protein [Actinomycetota bacterium]MDA8166389.1 DedA family protein [Actinomycetota bacterium]
MCIFYPSDDCRALFDIMLMYQHPTARRLPIGYIESITPQLGNWGYLLVFVMTFLETSAFVGLVVPGEVTLLLAGLLASQGYFDLSALIALASAGAILGDSTGYAIGRYGGIKFLRRFGRFFFFRESYLETAERYFQRHGGKTVLFGRFVGVLRSFAPVAAGISRMPYRTFLFYNIVGGIGSVTIVLLLGYFFGQSWELINRWLGWGGGIAFALVVVAGVIYLLIRRRRSGKNDTNR